MADEAAEIDVENADVLKAFETGFQTATPPAITATDGQPETKVDNGNDGKPEGQGTTPEAAKVVPEAPAPEYVQVTKEQFERLMAAADKVTSLDGTVSKVTGSVGNLHQVIKKLQESTPKGLTIELPDDVTSELQKEFPELAAPFRDALVKALASVKGTGDKGAEVDQAAVQKLVTDAVLQTQMVALEDDYPNWKEIVGFAAPGEHDPNNPFRKWLATQPEEYQAKVNDADTAFVVRKAIDKFNAFVETQKKAAAQPLPNKTAPKVDGRRLRIQNSVQPRGDGGPPPAGKSVQDAFEEGFKRSG